jgi:CRP-like cAMP-binding protein
MAAVRNSILTSLAMTDFVEIRQFLRPVALKARDVLERPRARAEYVDFVETGVVSQRTVSNRCLLETAMVGHRGLVGASIVLGAAQSTHQSIVLFAGSALRVAADDLYRLMYTRPQIRELLLRHVHTLLVQGAQTALCCVRHQLEQRLACWLCTACDALGAEVLSITHDELSTILGVRRPGLTEALIRFEEQGLIRKTRGVLQVLDIGMLRQKACPCYMVTTNSYKSSGSPVGNLQVSGIRSLTLLQQ